MRMIIAARLTAIALLGLGACSAWCLGGVVSARPTIDQAGYILHGTGPFSNSVASAIVTRLGGDRFRLSLTASHLPPPTTLREKFVRDGYVAWLVNGAVMHGPLRMAAMGLVAGGGAGNFAGQGTVTISGVTSVIITAEPTARAHMPIMPVLTVLAGAGRQL